jgi:hypothetical protein
MRQRIIGVGLAAVALCAMTGLAAAATAVKLPTGEGDISVTRDGQHLSVDPATGRLRPISPQVAQALMGSTVASTLMPTHSAPLTATQAANGMLVIQLGDDYMENMVLRILPDGRQVIDCVQGTDAVNQLMNADLPPLPAKSATVAPAAHKPAAVKKLTHTTTKR